jgi:predicted NUDIX family phosphoesterase
VIEELVFVVPRAVVMGTEGWHGIRDLPLEAFLEIIAAAGRYEPRGAMERDPSFKQVIPYLVLRDRDRYFLMRRTRAGVDARLHDLYSIGVGGHLNPGDGGLLQGLRREWEEELDAAFVPDFRMVGLLNDDTTDVGRVHVGAVFEADADGRAVAIRETDKLEGSFAEPKAVARVVDRMETWSRLVFDHLEAAARKR